MSDSTADSFQISPQQEQLWAGEPEGPSARIQAVLMCRGELASVKLADALRAVVGRHESLRTTFAPQAGLRFPLQQINALLEPRIETLELATLAAEQRSQRVADARRSELLAPFDLKHGPLVRAVLVVEGEQALRLILTISALCADHASTALLLGELATHLAGGELIEDPLQYADFSAWQHELSDSEESEARSARTFWRELGPVGSPELPFTGSVSKDAPQELSVPIEEALAQELAAQASRYGTTSAALAHAAWHAVLGRFSAQESTTVAFLAGERRHPDLEGSIGAFARAVPVQARVGATRAFAEVLAEVDRARGEALVNQDYAPAETTSLEIAFAEYPAHLDQPEGLQLSLKRIICTGPERRLIAMCGSDGERLTLSLVFDPARYPHTTVSGLAEGLARMLKALAGDPGVALGDVQLLSDDERRRILHAFNDTAAELPAERVHELIAHHALTTPERVAVLDGPRSITYGELNARANQLAHRLRGCGVGPGVAVGLCTDRSIEMVVALAGILKAGGAYVPLRYEHPPARLGHQLETTGAKVLVTQEPLLGRLPEPAGEVICLDRDRDALGREPSEAPEVDLAAEDLAYVIFTSGSTGAPKGVSVTHANLTNYAADIVRRLGADREQLSFGLVTSVSTDLGNTSVFGALCSGGTLVLVSPDAATDPGAFASLLEATPLDVLKITPSHIGALLRAGDPRVLPRRWLLVGGERAGWDLVDRVRALSSCAILNHYGPTETTIGSCTFLVGEGPGEYAPASVPIGRPISNTSCYVLDDGRRLTPVGVPGRLFISGAGVARGYVGEPELTAERFSADPFTPDGGAQMYDTGDLVRWLPDGTLEFLGRVDEQLKIRGYRVEPAEIEAALRSHSQVREAVTVTQASATGDLRLLAYCTTDGALEPDQLRAHLAGWLPEFMLPAAIVIVAEMPRTPSGKIDKLTLPDPDLASTPSAAYIAPRTPLEEAVAAIWAQVLGLPQVGVEDDFFALGGHSLLATQVVAQVRSDFAVDLPLHSLFTCPTIASLASEIVRMMGDSEVDETAKLMAELEDMSDEEAQRLLAQDVPPETGRH
ncbi:MAG: amino acid adenylation domain-containing protein [Solirubrobacterales bacterium]|nr:amino acid adenylation domain-containing protein [Solirubrobacterales bacterium]